MINIQNIGDNECFNWSIVKYLNHVDFNPVRITEVDTEFATRHNLKDIKFPVKIRDIYKIEKKISFDISVSGYENKEEHPIYVSKKCSKEKRVYKHLLTIREEGKRHYVLIKD